MKAWFDNVTKALASDLSRRDTLKVIGLTMTGAVLSTLGVRKAEAVDPCREVSCTACHAEDQCLAGKAGCSCIPKTRGICFCHDIVFCTDTVACTNNRDCREKKGRGWKCSNSCCGTNLCHPKCGRGPAAAQAAYRDAVLKAAAEGRGLTSAG